MTGGSAGYCNGAFKKEKTVLAQNLVAESNTIPGQTTNLHPPFSSAVVNPWCAIEKLNELDGKLISGEFCEGGWTLFRTIKLDKNENMSGRMV